MNPAQSTSAVVPLSDCEHPELHLFRETLTRSRGLRITCSACKVGIVIPDATWRDLDQRSMAGIIGMAFGAVWMGKVLRGEFMATAGAIR